MLVWETKMVSYCLYNYRHAMINFCAAVALLTLENIREVLDLTFPHRANWRQIGIQLDVDVGTIDAIEANRRKVEDCLTDLISHWLRNTKPKPTCGALTKALKSEHVSCTSGIIDVLYTDIRPL